MSTKKKINVFFIIVTAVIILAYGIYTDATRKTPSEIEAERREKEYKLHDLCMTSIDEIVGNAKRELKLTQLARVGNTYQLYDYNLYPEYYPTRHVYGGPNTLADFEQCGYRLEWESDGKHYSLVDFDCDGGWDYVSQGPTEGDKLIFWTEQKESDGALATKKGMNGTVVELFRSTPDVRVTVIDHTWYRDLKLFEQMIGC